MLLFYDYEVFKYDWLAVFIDPINDVKTFIVNDVEKLKQFHSEHQEDIWIGFNNRNYDQFIHKGILLGFDPYKINHFIINEKRKGWEFSRKFNTIKMYNYDVYKGITDSSLKTLEAFMGNDIEETSVPFDIDRKLNALEISETIKYCTHDVEQLIEVFKLRQDDFNTHLAMVNEFKLSLNELNKTTAQLISVILGTVKRDYNDEWDVFLPECLKLGKYKAVGDWFLTNRSNDALTYTVAGVEHIFADGGVHGAIPKFTYKCGPDEMMIMADVTSLYPSLMILFDLLSRSVSDKSKFKHIYDMNIELKKNKDPRRPVYKLICNTAYGCSGDKFNGMYDPRNRRLVCIYGQVLLLDLIEKLEPYCKLIQSNTDGILILIKRKDFDLIDDIVYEWEERTGLNMEFDFFERIYQKDVNNYVAVDYKGKYKTKGAYVKKLNRLDNDLPIVNEALINYMVNDIPLEVTINECNDFIKFQKVFKLSGKYDYVMHNNYKYYNKSYRVFASNDSSDTPLYKCKRSDGVVKSVINTDCKFFNNTWSTGDCGCGKYNGRCPFANKRGRKKCDWYREIGAVVLNADGVKCDRFANTPEHAFICNNDINDMNVMSKLDKSWYIVLAKERLTQFIGE